MKKYDVVLELVRGYYPTDEDGNCDPIIERKEFRGISADNENDAIRIAKELDKSPYSVYDTYADEADE